MTLRKVAIVTEKATGNRYDVYTVPSESDPMKSYAVGVRNGYACRCICRDRTFRPQKRCKHMLKLQAELDASKVPISDERRASAPLHQEAFSLTR